MIDEEIEDFVEDESVTSSDLFDCDYTPIDAVVNQSLCLPGVPLVQPRMETACLSLMVRVRPNPRFSPIVKSCGMCFATQIANSLSAPLSRW